MSRPATSVLPPGANGTINLMGRVGYCCADAVKGTTANASRTSRFGSLALEMFMTIMFHVAAWRALDWLVRRVRQCEIIRDVAGHCFSSGRRRDDQETS